MNLLPDQKLIVESDKMFSLMVGGMGSGKTMSLVHAALRSCCKYNYFAVIFCHSYSQAAALGKDSIRFFPTCGEEYNEKNRTRVFSNGSQLHFGHLEDFEQYLGSCFQFIGIDNLTVNTLHKTLFLRTKLRNGDGLRQVITVESDVYERLMDHEQDTLELRKQLACKEKSRLDYQFTDPILQQYTEKDFRTFVNRNVGLIVRASVGNPHMTPEANLL